MNHEHHAGILILTTPTIKQRALTLTSLSSQHAALRTWFKSAHADTKLDISAHNDTFVILSAYADVYVD
jgi:hypothetical protein